jgi:succinate dehydrogenase / fumarate reductase cytochrome b subunit
MVNFWAKMHFDKNMPLQTISVPTQMGGEQSFYLTSGWGKEKFIPVQNVDGVNVIVEGNEFFYAKPIKIKFAEGYKDLHKITFAFFQHPKTGLIFTVLYVLAMGVLAFHLWHGFQSAFQSLGVNNKFTPAIKTFGKLFAVIVPLLFAIIPLYIHFVK